MFPDNQPNYSRRGRIALVLFALTVIAATIVVLTSSKAGAADPDTRTIARCSMQWKTPGSVQAAICKSNGWVIRSRLVLDPDRRIRFMALRPCEYEDSDNCYWRAGLMGNGQGRSFVALMGRVYFVKWQTHR